MTITFDESLHDRANDYSPQADANVVDSVWRREE